MHVPLKIYCRKSSVTEPDLFGRLLAFEIPPALTVYFNPDPQHCLQITSSEFDKYRKKWFNSTPKGLLCLPPYNVSILEGHLVSVLRLVVIHRLK